MWQAVASYLLCQFLSKEISQAVSNSNNESMQQNSCNGRGGLGAGRKLIKQSPWEPEIGSCNYNRSGRPGKIVLTGNVLQRARNKMAT
jgi:hypothetical protein